MNFFIADSMRDFDGSASCAACIVPTRSAIGD